MNFKLNRRTACLVSGVLAIICLPAGCIEIQALLQGVVLPPSLGSSDGGSPDTGPGVSDPTSDVPSVFLSVSNETPGLSETVFLTCTRSAGSRDGLTYSFQPNDGTLLIDRAAGTASFTTSEPDVGTEFAFTCTAMNDFGTSSPSNRISVIPVG